MLVWNSLVASSDCPMQSTQPQIQQWLIGSFLVAPDNVAKVEQCCPLAELDPLLNHRWALVETEPLARNW